MLFEKVKKIDFPLYFKNVILKLPTVFSEIKHGCFKIFRSIFYRKITLYHFLVDI